MKPSDLFLRILCGRNYQNKYYVILQLIISLNFLLSIGCATTHEKKTQLTVDELFQRAASYQYKNESKAAIRDYSEVIARDPKRVEAYYSRGMCYFNEDIYLVISDLNKVISVKPNDIKALYYHAYANSLIGDTDAAITDYNKLITFFQTNPNPVLNLSDNEIKTDNASLANRDITYLFLYQYNAIFAKANILFETRRYCEAKNVYSYHLDRTLSDSAYSWLSTFGGVALFFPEVSPMLRESPYESPWSITRTISERRIKQLEPICREGIEKTINHLNVNIGIVYDDAIYALMKSGYIFFDNINTVASVGPDDSGIINRVTILKFENQKLSAIINQDINNIESTARSVYKSDLANRINMSMSSKTVHRITEALNDQIIYDDKDTLISYGYYHLIKDWRLKVYVFNNERLVEISYHSIPKSSPK